MLRRNFQQHADYVNFFFKTSLEPCTGRVKVEPVFGYMKPCEASVGGGIFRICERDHVGTALSSKFNFHDQISSDIPQLKVLTHLFFDYMRRVVLLNQH